MSKPALLLTQLILICLNSAQPAHLAARSLGMQLIIHAKLRKVLRYSAFRLLLKVSLMDFELIYVAWTHVRVRSSRSSAYGIQNGCGNMFEESE